LRYLNRNFIGVIAIPNRIYKFRASKPLKTEEKAEIAKPTKN
jgi:hypothetical protein